MLIATITERVVHEFDSRKAELIMSVLRWSVMAATCMNFYRSSYSCLSFGELYKHPTLPRNCLACITHAGLYLPGHIMKL